MNKKPKDRKDRSGTAKAPQEKKEKKMQAPGFIRRFPLPLVYICSPYAGDVEKNVEKAKQYCRFAIANYCIPIAPHLFFPAFLRDEVESERKIGMYCATCLLDKCSEVWIFGSELTDGMKQEIWRAKMRGKEFRMFTENMKEIR